MSREMFRTKILQTYNHTIKDSNDEVSDLQA